MLAGPETVMKVCLISTEIFAWGKAGGFGRAARIIGRELVQRGVRVYAVVPRRGNQRPVEELDGITVLSFPRHWPPAAVELCRSTGADLFHSCELSYATLAAMRALPGRKQVITFRDPRDWEDWKLEFARPSLNRLQVAGNWFYESNPLMARAVRRMDRTFCAARYMIPKVAGMYRLSQDPSFLPTPVAIPPAPSKAATPTVCYMARLDRRKRPELFFELARRFPQVRFLAAGKSRDAGYEGQLRATYAHLPNLEFLGFIDQFADSAHSEILGSSWIMVNTATREGLPNSFLEASAHRCAILSQGNPDGFASQFGYHAAADDFSEGLAWLLEGDRWRAAGERGFAFVRDIFATDRAIDLHLAAYGDILAAR